MQSFDRKFKVWIEKEADLVAKMKADDWTKNIEEGYIEKMKEIEAFGNEIILSWSSNVTSQNANVEEKKKIKTKILYMKALWVAKAATDSLVAHPVSRILILFDLLTK